MQMQMKAQESQIKAQMDAVAAKASQIQPIQVQPLRPQPEVQMQNQGMVEVNTFERHHDQNEIKLEFARKKTVLD